MTAPQTSQNLHFRILEDIARDLSGEVNFPTYLDASLSVRNVLKDPMISIEKVVQVVGVEPLIVARLLKLANSIAYNPSGREISDIEYAIQRVGFETVRVTALAVAMEQMSHSTRISGFEDVARLTWEHSLEVASIGRVLARRIGRIDADDAMLLGIVRNIGVFYLLYRASAYPEYATRENVIYLISGWHDSIGENLLTVLDIPAHIVEAFHEHSCKRHNATPCNLSDVLYFACLLAENNCPWLSYSSAANSPEAEADRALYLDILEEADEDIRELRSVLRA
ncbi:MAG: HDOD domain-containing protein [Zoogloeaceae bacterium]|jgi:HD-like signal output (HDOD) protein|nr:HDOD domain-containing protein [Zoogloeaceae bacterium]